MSACALPSSPSTSQSPNKLTPPVLPWLTAALMLWGTGYLSDWLLRRSGRLRVARSHVIWVTQLLAGLCILPVIFVHRLDVALVFITLAVGLGMSSNACFYAVNVDVATGSPVHRPTAARAWARESTARRALSRSGGET